MTAENIKILLVEDEPGNLHPIWTMLVEMEGRPFKLERTDQISVATERLDREEIGVVLLDLALLGSYGLKALESLRAQAPSVPLILITNRHQERLALQAMQKGAHDYVVMGQANHNELERRIRNALKCGQTEKKYREMEEELKVLQASRERGRTRIQELKTAEVSLKGIVERNADGLLVLDTYGKVLFANPAATSFLDRSSEDLIGYPFGIPLVRGEMTEIDVVRGNRGPGVAEMRFKETEWDGEVATLVMLRDITGRKKTQEQSPLPELLRVLSGFAGRMADEIGNSLRKIESSADALERELEDPDERALLQLGDIRSQAEVAKAVIRNLGSLRRLEAPEKGRSDIADVITVGIARAELPASVELISELPSGVLYVDADNEQLSMVFMKILKTAVQGMEDGGTISVSGDKTSIGWIEAKIEDTGSSLRAEDLKRNLKTFLNTETETLGIGLGLCRAIVENHGGRMEVQSVRGKGATFRVILPPTGS